MLKRTIKRGSYSDRDKVLDQMASWLQDGSGLITPPNTQSYVRQIFRAAEDYEPFNKEKLALIAAKRSVDFELAFSAIESALRQAVNVSEAIQRLLPVLDKFHRVNAQRSSASRAAISKRKKIETENLDEIMSQLYEYDQLSGRQKWTDKRIRVDIYRRQFFDKEDPKRIVLKRIKERLVPGDQLVESSKLSERTIERLMKKARAEQKKIASFLEQQS